MSDLNRHDDEEYHFDDSETFDFGEHDAAAEEEFVGDEEVVENADTNKTWIGERSASAPNKKPLPTKKILMAAGVVMLLVVGYYLMRPRVKTPATPAIPTAKAPSTTSTATSPVSKPMASTSDTTMTPQQTVASSTTNTAVDNATNGDWLGADNNAPSAADSPQASVPPTTAAPENALDETNLPLQVQTLSQENQTLTLKLQQVTAQSEATAARASNLEKVVAQLQSQIKQMSQTPAPLKRPQPAESMAATPRTSAATNDSKTRLVYYVQAIIPGRAWIADSNGRIITVTQGDRVEALSSTVKDIDPINGVVTLSNGMQIEYGMVAQ